MVVVADHWPLTMIMRAHTKVDHSTKLSTEEDNCIIVDEINGTEFIRINLKLIKSTAEILMLAYHDNLNYQVD